MKATWVAADRSREVREAFRGWRAAGLVENATVAAADSLHPDCGPRVEPVWRALIFVFSLVAAGALVAFYFMATDFREPMPAALSLGLFGTLLVLLTERIAGRFSLAVTGGEAASSLAALLCLTVAGALLLRDVGIRGEDATRLILLLAGLLAAAASWRWGFWVYAAGATASLLGLLATFAGGRLLWLLSAAPLALVAGWAAARPGPSPSHRRCLLAIQGVSLAAIYLAVNCWSLDEGLVESLRSRRVAPWGVVLTWLPSVLATSFLPAGVLLRGILARRRLLVDAGLLMAAASLVTLRHYLHLAPLWIVLTGVGGGLILLSMAVSRFLIGGRDGERGGLTATSLGDESRRERLLPALTAVTLAPEARTPPERPFQGGGGEFGGGGTGGKF